MKAMKLTKNGVLRFFLFVLVAFVMWLFVMYTESPEYDRKYSDIEVELRNYVEDYAYDFQFDPTVDMTFRGTNLDLADCDSEDIVAVVDMGGRVMYPHVTYTIPVTFEFKGETKLQELSSMSLNVTCTPADMVTARFENLSVDIRTAGTKLADYDTAVNAITAVEVVGRAEDVAALKSSRLKAYISPTAQDVNDIEKGCADGKPYTHTMMVQFEVKDGMVVSGIDVLTDTRLPEVMVTVTFTPPEGTGTQVGGAQGEGETA